MGSKRKAVILISVAVLLAVSVFLTFIPGWAVIFDLFGLKDLDSTDRIVFIDVGQGDSALILSNGHTVLLDCGTGADGGDGIRSAIRQAGVESIDCLILSHPHHDHIGGASTLLAEYPIDCIRMPNDQPSEKADLAAYQSMMQSAANWGVPVEYLQTGDSFTVGHFTFDVLLCDDTAEDENDRSAVIRVSNGKNAVLFTGDAGKEAEYKLIEMGCALSCDLLKVGHHGSNTSTSEKFLYLTDPDAAVISVGDNGYGHPTDGVIERLSAQDTAIYRTDANGNITVYLEGAMTFETEYGT